VTARGTDHPAADVLRVLAVSRSSGALEIRGTPSGTIFLHAGEITFAEATGLPTVPDDPDLRLNPELQSMVYSAVMEAGLTLLSGSTRDSERPLFRPGRRHWTGLVCRLGVEVVLGEIDRQLQSFTRLGVDPDNDVQLRSLPRGGLAVLDRRQWALAVAITQPQSARALSRLSGVPLSATIATVASLVEVGVLEFGVTDPDPAPITPEVMREPGAAIRELVRLQAVRRPGDAIEAFPGLSGPGGPPAGAPPMIPEPDDEPPTVANPTSEPEVPPPQAFTKRPPTPPAAPKPEERLPHRIRGATSLPASLPEPEPTFTSGYDNGYDSGYDNSAEGSQALALRLLEGLRRL
jgi:hypothetical protein